MASDGGYINARPYENHPGWSVRDEFAKAIVAGDGLPAGSTQILIAEAKDVYDYAQLLTDEKLRRDQADRDVPDRQSSAHDCGGTGYSRVWPDRGQGPFIAFTATSDDLHCELCERTAQTIYVCTRCQCIICHPCWAKGEHVPGASNRDEGTDDGK